MPGYRGNIHVIVDIANPRKPKERGRWWVNSEDISYGKGPASFAAIVDIADPARPFLLSVFPQPVPPRGAPYRSFAEQPGWSGPHNSNTLLHNPDAQRQGDLKNQGLWILRYTGPSRRGSSPPQARRTMSSGQGTTMRPMTVVRT
jgi:hypothetical protein